jgi:3-hydroxyisobutyrate dehydrogenase
MSTKIAFLGMGLLGSNFTRALRRRGEAVQVWNRSPGKARAVAGETGAVAFDDPAAAVRGAARVHLVLSDDAAVDDVLERAAPGLAAGAVIVDHTTASPAGTAERARRWAGRGHPFLHAPVFMGPQQALEGQGIMLASGEKALFDRLEPDLARMTGKLVWLGEPPEKAAAYKLLGNQFLVAMTAGLVDCFALAKGMGLGPADVEALFGTFNPGASIPFRLKRILAADYANPSWSLAMARKDTRLMLEAAAGGGVPLAVMPAIAAEMDRWIAAGHAAEDWTVIGMAAVKGKQS